MKRPAFYASPGSVPRDLLALLHPPYTAWNLAHVVAGAAVAPRVNALILAGTLLAFFFGLGIGAHALDELHGRPLRTSLSQPVLVGLGVGGMVIALVLAVAGVRIVSPWLLAWAVLGIALAAGYALEVPRTLHTPLGFALAWGAFPVLVGYWAQTQTIGLAAVFMAAAMTLLSLAQRALSTPARKLRRTVERAELTMQSGSVRETWDEDQMLDTWERPLKFLATAVVVLALALLLAK